MSRSEDKEQLLAECSNVRGHQSCRFDKNEKECSTSEEVLEKSSCRQALSWLVRSSQNLIERCVVGWFAPRRRRLSSWTPGGKAECPYEVFCEYMEEHLFMYIFVCQNWLQQRCLVFRALQVDMKARIPHFSENFHLELDFFQQVLQHNNLGWLIQKN